MSVAYELDPADAGDYCSPTASPAAPRPRRALSLVAPPAEPLVVPPRSRPATRRQHRPAAVDLAVLRPLDDPAPLRLTRRGVVVVGLALAVVGFAVVLFGALSARSAAPASPAVGPAVVTVQAGDTLWSIASHAAPGQDPRAEIATIHRLNDLHGQALVPGQRLRVR